MYSLILGAIKGYEQNDRNNMTDEIWKAIVEFEGIYEVSNQGRVRRIGSKRGATVGKILKPMSRGRREYLEIGLYKNNKKITKLVHRIVLESFDGLPEKHEECNHKNGIKIDNKLTNLEWVTRSQNILHKFRTLKYEAPNGENNGRSKLKSNDILKIRKLCIQGSSQKDIAKQFHVHTTTISNIKNNKTWKHI